MAAFFFLANRRKLHLLNNALFKSCNKSKVIMKCSYKLFIILFFMAYYLVFFVFIIIISLRTIILQHESLQSNCAKLQTNTFSFFFLQPDGRTHSVWKVIFIRKENSINFVLNLFKLHRKPI